MDMNKVKRAVVEQALADEGSAWISLLTSKPGVVVPSGLKDWTMLYIGYSLEPPIPDLWVDDEGFTGTLLFETGTFTVNVPWEAVINVHDGEVGVAFFNTYDTPEPPAVAPTPKSRRHLKLVPKEAA